MHSLLGQKHARGFLSSAVSQTMKICKTLMEKVTAWYIESAEELYLRKALLL